MENNNQFPPSRQTCTAFPTGKRELLFAALTAVWALLLCNSLYAGGLNLGFGVCAIALIGSSFGYLWCAGFRPGAYSGALLIGSLLIAAGFGWSCDGPVELVMLAFFLVSANLGLCLMAGKNAWDPGKVQSLLDAPQTLFQLGFGKLPESCKGLTEAIKADGAGRKGGAFLLGLGFAVPVLAVVLPLLTGADAAFEGLISRLPEVQIGEMVFTFLFGVCLGAVLFTQGVALCNAPVAKEKSAKNTGISAITVNTMLVCLCIVYLVYLLSQLAYFVGGFSGLLPEGYSLAEYARRGFFEMAALCAVDLAVMVVSLALVKKTEKAPRSTRVLCLLIGLVTLFLVCTASAKMFMYIDRYGMSRLRLLTQIAMLFLGLTTLVVSVWLFVPRLPYMKAVLLGALVIGIATMWMDVDTQVARYNVDAYLSGKLETVDVNYLSGLSDGALLELERLAQCAPEQWLSNHARRALRCRYPVEDLRGFNYFNAAAQKWNSH